LDEFEKLLLQYKSKKFLVIEPLGSNGDKLIFMGMEKKLKELEINYSVANETRSFLSRTLLNLSKKFSKLGLQTLSKELMRAVIHSRDLFYKELISKIENSPAEIILLRGGAYLNDIWREYHILTTAIEAIRKKPGSILILASHSFIFKDTKFEKFFDLTNKVHIFCREKYSHNVLSAMSLPKNVELHLSDDTALYLSKNDFVNSKTENRSSYVLITLRNDRESAGPWKIKIPKEENVLFKDIYTTDDFKSFVNIIINAQVVHTDRLHVAILSGIIGKQTYLYPCNYHKTKGVYEFSLHKFPNIDFIDSHEICL
jgi:exopolysaccharide biosynthesis predicted pyruvyltransferase EpsI